MTDTLPIGTILVDEYQIIGVLGGGGFGNTYLARDLQLDREVAVKEFYPREIALREADTTVRVKSTKFEPSFSWGLERFVQEARMLAKFRHPNIVRVFRTFECNNTSYIVLDYVRGSDLEAWLKSLGRPPGQEDLDLLIAPLVEALEFVHAAGILHRDIKPANICVREETGDPVLLDFGASKYSLGNLTGTTAAIISRGYSPYEAYAADSKSQGPWTDIYGLGATLYRAITQEPPPEATERVLGDTIQPLHARAKELSGYRPDFLAAIDWALSVQPNARPQSVVEWKPRLFKGLADTGNSWATQMRRLGDQTELRSPRTVDTKTPAKTVAPKSSGKKRGLLVGTAAFTVLACGAGLGAVYLDLVDRTDLWARVRALVPKSGADQSSPAPPRPDAETKIAIPAAASGASGTAQENRSVLPPAGEVTTAQKAIDVAANDDHSPGAESVVSAAPLEPGSQLFSSEDDGPLNAAALSFDGRILIAGGYNGSLRMWDVASGKLSGRYHPTGKPILAIDKIGTSGGARQFLAATADNSLWLWSPDQGKLTNAQIDMAPGGFIRAIGYSAPAGYAVSISTSASATRLTTWRLDAASGSLAEAFSIDLAPGLVRAAAIARDADLAVIVKSDDTLEAVSPGKGKTSEDLRWIKPAPGWTSVVALSQDGTLLARGGHYPVVTVFDLKSRRSVEVKLDDQSQAFAQAITFSADGARLAVSYQTYAEREVQNLVRIISVPDGAVLHTFHSPPSASRWLTFLPGGNSRTGLGTVEGGAIRFCATLASCGTGNATR